MYILYVINLYIYTLTGDASDFCVEKGSGTNEIPASACAHGLTAGFAPDP